MEGGRASQACRASLGSGKFSGFLFSQRSTIPADAAPISWPWMWVAHAVPGAMYSRPFPHLRCSQHVICRPFISASLPRLFVRNRVITASVSRLVRVWEHESGLIIRRSLGSSSGRLRRKKYFWPDLRDEEFRHRCRGRPLRHCIGAV